MKINEFVQDRGGDNGKPMSLEEVADIIMKYLGDKFTVVKAKHTSPRWDKLQPGFNFIPNDKSKYGPAKIWTSVDPKSGIEFPVFHSMLGEYQSGSEGRVTSLLRPAEKFKEKTYENAVRTALSILDNTKGALKGSLAESSGYIPTEAERNDPRFKMALSVDIGPDAIKKNARAFGSTIARDGRPPKAKTNGSI